MAAIPNSLILQRRQEAFRRRKSSATYYHVTSSQIDRRTGKITYDTSSDDVYPIEPMVRSLTQQEITVSNGRYDTKDLVLHCLRSELPENVSKNGYVVYESVRYEVVDWEIPSDRNTIDIVVRRV